MILLILALALPCWVLASRTRAVGWRVGGALAALLVGEASVDLRWVLPEARVTLLVVLALATAMTLAAGLNADRRASTPSKPWSAVGLVLSCLYCGMAVLGVCGVVFLYGINGLPPSTPPTSAILPLPPGLTVTGNTDEHCSGGSTLFCAREIYIASTTGLADSAVVEELDAWLSADGWADGCRHEGILLDRNTQCVQVGVARDRVSMELDDSSGW